MERHVSHSYSEKLGPYTELILNKERHKQSVDLKAWAAYPTKSEKHPNGRYILKWQARKNRVFFFTKRTNKELGFSKTDKLVLK